MNAVIISWTLKSTIPQQCTRTFMKRQNMKSKSLLMWIQFRREDELVRLRGGRWEQVQCLQHEPLSSSRDRTDGQEFILQSRLEIFAHKINRVDVVLRTVFHYEIFALEKYLQPLDSHFIGRSSWRSGLTATMVIITSFVRTVFVQRISSDAKWEEILKSCLHFEFWELDIFTRTPQISRWAKQIHLWETSSNLSLRLVFPHLIQLRNPDTNTKREREGRCFADSSSRSFKHLPQFMFTIWSSD